MIYLFLGWIILWPLNTYQTIFFIFIPIITYNLLNFCFTFYFLILYILIYISKKNYSMFISILRIIKTLLKLLYFLRSSFVNVWPLHIYLSMYIESTVFMFTSHNYYRYQKVVYIFYETMFFYFRVFMLFLRPICCYLFIFSYISFT